ncbi:MAG: hypothetical protein U0X39_01655 [Bacteroidales bacterium]
MKSATKFILFTALMAVSSIALQGQKATFETNKGLTIGFGVGGAWQKSDIPNSSGGGFDFDLGSYLYKKQNALLSLDWKFRFLAGENTAFDHIANTDGTYSNIRYGFFNYDFELGLTLNRLRERTRIVLSGFAGLGITHGFTATNLLDADGNLYDYTVIDPTAGKKQIYNDLLALADGSFETKLTNHAALLPTAGFYAGYQFTRSFSLGVEFKTNFYLNENNSFAGLNLDNRINHDSKKDRNNYLTLGFRWVLGGGGGGGSRRIYYPPVTDNPPVNNMRTEDVPKNYPPAIPVESSPVVDIVIPSADTYTTTLASIEITARVRNVNSKQDIKLQVNGRNTGFDYNQVYGSVKSNVVLSDPRNVIRITAINNTGSASDEVVVIVNRQTIVPGPSVRFTEPASAVTVSGNSFRISASTTNVKFWQDVSLRVNGEDITNFNLTDQGIVTSNIGLNLGINKVELSVKNESGKASAVALITRELPVKPIPPAITIISPVASPYRTYETGVEIKARVSGVISRDNISVTLNGTIFSAFRFDQGEMTVVLTPALVEGSNTIVLTARNNSGQDIRNQVIIKETKPCPLPEIKITYPDQEAMVTDKQNIIIKASLRSVDSREKLSINLNGKDIKDFTIVNKELSFEAMLTPGANTFNISASNECGKAKAAGTIIYRPADEVIIKPCEKPSLSFSIEKSNSGDATHVLTGNVENVKSRNGISVTVNDRGIETFKYDPESGKLSESFSFGPGTFTIRVTVTNECGSVVKSSVVVVEKPCEKPNLSFSIEKSNQAGTTHVFSGSIENVKSRDGITMSVNDNKVETFRYDPATGKLSESFNFGPGTWTIKVFVNNECGSDSKVETAVVEKPCSAPTISLTIKKVSVDSYTHEIIARVTNISTREGIKITVDNEIINNFSYEEGGGELKALLKLEPGTHGINVTVRNDCGSDMGSETVVVEKPCLPPVVELKVTAVNSEDASHELRGSVLNVKDREGISLSLDNKPVESFTFSSATGEIKSSVTLLPGSHLFRLTARNECGEDSGVSEVKVEEKPCGVRFNPGNSDWEFCLVTPSVTIVRDSLTNRNFTYSGQASSLYLKPIAGGGDAVVNGKPYRLNTGQYYLFSGNLRVVLSNRNPGSMGQWSICISSDREPVSGNGSDRPVSPCETDKRKKENENDKQ